MKKIILILVSIIFLISCDKDPKDMHNAFFYIHDKNTGLCYSFTNIIFYRDEIDHSGVFNSGSMTCVPCDSLKKYKVISIK